MMPDHLHFSDRAAFRRWLSTHGESSDGVWLLFGKSRGPVTLTAREALEEALCFGWIDGQMRKLDDASYIKYFARRRPASKWSEKNRALVQVLEDRGRMTDEGRRAVDEAKADGRWDAPKAAVITPDQIAAVADLLKEHEAALENFEAMPPSVRKTYARAYFDARTDAGRERRLAWMVDRLERNLRPM